MTKAILELSLAVELTEHLGYEQGEPAGHGSGNSRNGSTSKRLLIEAGQMNLEIPRDRNSTFARRGSTRANASWSASTSS